MVEIQQENIETLKNIFGKNANIFNLDFVTDSMKHIKFTYIIGNPPYNINGIKKVPTNREKNKKKDGQTLWFEFIKTSLKLLEKNGKLIMIVPSIWMKPINQRLMILCVNIKSIKYIVSPILKQTRYSMVMHKHQLVIFY